MSISRLQWAVSCKNTPRSKTLWMKKNKRKNLSKRMLTVKAVMIVTTKIRARAAHNLLLQKFWKNNLNLIKMRIFYKRMDNKRIIIWLRPNSLKRWKINMERSMQSTDLKSSARMFNSVSRKTQSNKLMTCCRLKVLNSQTKMRRISSSTVSLLTSSWAM